MKDGASPNDWRSPIFLGLITEELLQESVWMMDWREGYDTLITDAQLVKTVNTSQHENYSAYTFLNIKKKALSGNCSLISIIPKRVFSSIFLNTSIIPLLS